MRAKLPKKPTIRAPSRAGFTLLEAMVVITIIAISAALAAPAIGNALADSKLNQAAQDAVRLFRRARSEAVAYGRAHVVRFSNADDGRFELYRGINNGCNSNDWDTIFAEGDCQTAGSMCIDSVDFTGTRYDGGNTEAQVTWMGGNFIELCFEPSGSLEWRTTTGNANRFAERNTDAGGNSLGNGALFRFRRVDDGGARVGVDRWVVVPRGADPRIRR